MLDILEIAAGLLADPLCWTCHYRAACRWRISNRDRGKIKVRACSPKDTRAVRWTALGALEVSAVDSRSPRIVDALEALRDAGGGRSIYLVEEYGHCWMLWSFAAAIVRTRARLRGATLRSLVRHRGFEVLLHPMAYEAPESSRRARSAA